VTCFHGCYPAGGDTLRGVSRRRKGAAQSLAALKSIRAARPDGAPIYVIMDNLPAHKGTTIRTRAGKHRAGLCFTPASASRADPVEARLGPLRQFTLASPSHTARTRALHACLRWRNASARRPGVLAAQRCERARARSEKGLRRGSNELKRYPGSSP
jgi:hypothetical protein